MKHYKINNWSQYNRALKQRGSITFWFNQESADSWFSSAHTCRKGRPKIYSDEAMLGILMIRSIFHLPLMALEGFLGSLMRILGLSLSVPSYTQISRRAGTLQQCLKKLRKKRPVHIVFYSTGFKVYGEGEWKIRVHGKSKRRTWRKLHLAMDPDTHEIMICGLTLSTGNDAKVAEKMMRKSPTSIQKVYADGAYDSQAFRQVVTKRDAEAIVPPPKNAAINNNAQDGVEDRNDAINAIEEYGGEEEGRKRWKEKVGYHRRSLVETTMFRLKKLMGAHLRSRTFKNQAAESWVRCAILNKLTRLGVPSGS